MSTLIIAEKSQAAKAIAAALGQSNPIKESKFITVQHIPSKNIYVLPLRGHILSYKNTEEFKSWAKSNPREIITNPSSIKKVPTHNIPGMKRITGLPDELKPTILDSSVIDEICDVSDDDAYRTGIKLARKNGILVGPSTGAILSVALEYAKDHEGLAVIIAPDDALKYVSNYASYVENESNPIF